MIVVSAGKIALEETAKKFADMTATEGLFGFGDLFCDHRSPLAKVEVFKTGEIPLDEDVQTLLDKAKTLHNKTKRKKELDKRFYGIEDKETEEDAIASPDTPTLTTDEGNDTPDSNDNQNETITSNTDQVVETPTNNAPKPETVVEQTPEEEETPEDSDPEESTKDEVEDLINELDEFINGNNSPNTPDNENQELDEP